MTSIMHTDLSLYGDWPKLRACEPVLAIETKSLPQEAGTESGPDGLWQLMNEMTAEMREQFRFFRDLREGAGAALDEAGDDAAGKLARADVKAATDAMSLIIRTLEKIDTLQRQLARDREALAESEAEKQSYDDAVRYFNRRIDELVRQRVEAELAGTGVPAQSGQVHL